MKTQNQTDEATARPWTIGEDDDGKLLIVRHDSKNHCVDITPSGLTKDNAALIVQAVNEHAALVAVAEKNHELELLASIAVEYHGTSEALMAARKIQSIVTTNRNNLAAARGQ